MKIVHIVGARPNFMKIAPIMEAMGRHKELDQFLIHTGQHYDQQMSSLFFDDLKIPKPDIYLGVGSGPHGIQTAKVMMELEPVLTHEKPDWLLVVGDVNSTVAASLTASKLGIRIAHVEAGLRSFDRSMPEEINRLVTDAISDALFTTERSGNENLVREGVPAEKIFFVGNVMIDTMLKFRDRAEGSSIRLSLGLANQEYALLTLHRPASVDEPGQLRRLISSLTKISNDIPIVFPCHPRTLKKMEEAGIRQDMREGNSHKPQGMVLTEPLGYLDFLHLMHHSKFVLTDSGGIQEETTVLGIPCLTLRENTERPVTLREGTNTLVGYSENRLLSEVQKIMEGRGKKGRVPEFWDGSAAQRIVETFLTGRSVKEPSATIPPGSHNN